MSTSNEVERLVDAVTSAVRQSISRMQQPPGQGLALGSTQSPIQRASTPYQRASGLQGQGTSAPGPIRPSLTFQPPIMFRSRRKKANATSGSPKSISYVRDIMCQLTQRKSKLCIVFSGVGPSVFLDTELLKITYYSPA